MNRTFASIKKVNWLILVFVFSISFISCEKEEDVLSKFDGHYLGKTLLESGEETGNFDIDIKDQIVTGDYYYDGGTKDIHSAVSDQGSFNLVISLSEKNILSGRATISSDKTSLSGTWEDYNDNSGNITGQRGGSSSGGSSGGSSGSCSSHKLIGKWYTQSGNIDIQFTGSCTGTLHYKDVNNTPGCESGSVTKFKWSTSDNILSLDYTSMTVCGEKRNPPNDDPQQFSVSGDKLTWAGTTWTKK